jgi:hypothetical protein
MSDHDGLHRRLCEMRSRLNDVFAPDTAAPGTIGAGYGHSNGHCAAVAIILRDIFGGEYVSATVNGVSHWFNRIINDAMWVDVDITGDQFGRGDVRIGNPGTLWEGTRSRSAYDVNADTQRRSALLRMRLTAKPDSLSPADMQAGRG